LKFIHVILLAFIQGLTEFFPVSSSGHLVIFQHIFGFQEPQIFLDVMLHVGTLLSLLVFLRFEIRDIFLSLVRYGFHLKKGWVDLHYRRLIYLITASIPTFLIGYFFSGFFESLFESPRPVGLALLGTAFFLFVTRFASRRSERFPAHPLLIGVFQGAAIVPGFSRSGFTIGSALLLGWKREQAARFSFLLSIPAILGASLFQYLKIDSASQPWPLILAGVLVSAAAGYAALVFLYKIVQHGRFHFFAYYCLAAALLILFNTSAF
jgi:undecaprenyl-diphosphatase